VDIGCSSEFLSRPMGMCGHTKSLQYPAISISNLRLERPPWPGSGFRRSGMLRRRRVDMSAYFDALRQALVFVRRVKL